jgi:hypothetical protein
MAELDHSNALGFVQCRTTDESRWMIEKVVIVMTPGNRVVQKVINNNHDSHCHSPIRWSYSVVGYHCGF